MDLSYLAGDGVFAAWEDPVFFASVYISPSEASVGARIDLWPDAWHIRLTDTRSKSLDA